jgi:hypothetical protein
MKKGQLSVLVSQAKQQPNRSPELLPLATQLGNNPRISLRLAPLTSDVGKADYHFQQVIVRNHISHHLTKSSL